MKRVTTGSIRSRGARRRRTAGVHRALFVALAAALFACTSTYVEDEMPDLDSQASEAPCQPGDTRPGCNLENPECQDPTDELCAPL